MKIVKIFGIVVAVHLVAFVVIFVNPGCRSTTSKPTSPSTMADSSAPSGSRTSSASDSDPVARPAGMGASDLNPGSSVPTASDVTPSVSFSPPSNSGSRSTPTRPGTPAATSFEPAPQIDSTPVATYTTTKGDTLWTVAKKNNITISELAKANNLKATAALKLGQKLIIPGKAPATTASASSAAGASAEAPVATYKVKSGDSLASIAKRTGTTVAAIKAANKLKNDTVKLGQELKLPSGSQAPVASNTETSAAAPTIADKPNASGAMTHTVKASETLGTIAKKYKISVGELATANNISDPSKVRLGQELVIPGFKSVGSNANAGAAPAAGSTSAPASNPVKIQLAPPSASEDLDAGLKNQPTTEAPVIKVEEGTTPPKS